MFKHIWHFSVSLRDVSLRLKQDPICVLKMELRCYHNEIHMTEIGKKNAVLVIFGDTFPQRFDAWLQKYGTIIARSSFKEQVEAHGCVWEDLDAYKEAGSIYEANALLVELSRIVLPNGTRLTKSVMYKGYELWWIHYTDLFLNFCLPYTQYKKLLEHLKDFPSVHLYQPPFENLFACHAKAHEYSMTVQDSVKYTVASILPFGILIQIVLTILFLPWILFNRRTILLFIGDKFAHGSDFDGRMRFIYKALRERNLPFVEYVRSMESWKTILTHAFKRRRPVVYATAIKFIARYASIMTGGRYYSMHRFSPDTFKVVSDKDMRFKLTIATQYLLTVAEDEWEILFMKLLTHTSGVQTAFIPAGNDRNFHTLLGCKLNSIPTVGILHGVASSNYNVYDFMPAYDGDKRLSVDTYGVWSEWWRDYYVKNSRVYQAEQLYISGPMRPLVQRTMRHTQSNVQDDVIRVLLVSEIVAVPTEIVPYLDALLQDKSLETYIKFRPHNDSFETWLQANRPDILDTLGKERVIKGDMIDAIESTDVVVGSQSTGVIESTLLSKPFVLFHTGKWGDYFDMESFDSPHNFFAKTPARLIEYVKEAKDVPESVLKDLREKFFGDPYKNGSSWVVDQLNTHLNRTKK